MGKLKAQSLFAALLLTCCVPAALLIYKSTSMTIPCSSTTVPPLSNYLSAPQQANSHSSFQLAIQQSYGFFDDISDTNWRLLQTLFRDHENHRFPDKPYSLHPQAQAHQSVPELYRLRNNHAGWSSYPAWYAHNYEPNFSCQFEKRVGLPMNGDGPKWICDPHRITKLAKERKAKDPNHPGCVVYSIGSNGDFKFELGLQKEVGVDVCEFHIFDMGNYAEKVPKELKRTTYHRWGFKRQGGDTTGLQKGKPGDANEYLGLKDTIKTLGHEKLDVIDIFKIDCEKCEWETYQDWLLNDIPMLHQILVEVHEAPINKATDFFDSLEAAGYLRFHKEPNIQWDTSCIEYAFVKLDKSFMKGEKFGQEIKL